MGFRDVGFGVVWFTGLKSAGFEVYGFQDEGKEREDFLCLSEFINFLDWL